MRSIRFYAKSNRSGDLLHIETDGAIINIRVGLHDGPTGEPVTLVQVLPDDQSRGGDGEGRLWRAAAHQSGVRVTRLPADDQ